MRSHPAPEFLAFVLAVSAAGCKKPPVSASASAVPLSKTAAPTAVDPAKGDTVHFAGEVSRGKQFRHPLGSNLFFALEPYAGNDSGWTIRLMPGTDAKSTAMDCIGAISEPLHGSKNLEIEPPAELSSQRAVNWKPREFVFAPDAASCHAAWDLMNAVYYPSKLTDEQRTEAGEKLGKIPVGHGRFTIIQSVLRPPRAASETGYIEWLKFEVELNFPDGTAGAALAPSTAGAQQSHSNSGGGIHTIDLEKFLKTRYLEVQPDLAYLKEECAEDRDPILSVTIQYGDLDGDGQDEAVYQGITCMAGTAGIDFYGVLKLMPDGKLIALAIKEEAKEFRGRRNLHEGIRGKLGLQIENGRLLEIYPVYRGDEPNCCPEGGQREFVYRWDGHQFVLDDIIDVPPPPEEKKSGI